MLEIQQLDQQYKRSDLIRSDHVANATWKMPHKFHNCRECGARFECKRATDAFCQRSCRATFHNRAAARGADIYNLFMALRYERGEAAEAGVWSLLCRLAASYKTEDDRERGGRRSWDSIDKVKARNVHLGATVVNSDITGARRRSA